MSAIWLRFRAPLLVAVACAVSAASAQAQSGDAADEMARKLQNPLANIHALMTDNAVGFDTGDDEGTSYAFQLQPVYAIDLPDQGFTFLPRAVIPILGLEAGTDLPRVGVDGRPTPSGGGSVWGLGDSFLQLFFAPHVESGWKWGVGPQFSFPTASRDALKGPGWGVGIGGVVTGEITPELSFAGLVANHWAYDGSFSTLTVQPMLFYNIPQLPGAALAYNAVISADWKAAGGDRWTVPLGLSFHKTFDMGGGHGFDVGGGPYYNVARPSGAARWQLRFGLSWIFP